MQRMCMPFLAALRVQRSGESGTPSTTARLGSEVRRWSGTLQAAPRVSAMSAGRAEKGWLLSAFACELLTQDTHMVAAVNRVKLIGLNRTGFRGGQLA